MNEILKKIKRKKELSDISNGIVEDVLNNYLRKNNILMPKTEKEIKLVVKEVRAELRKYVGRFQVKFSFKKRLDLLKKKDFEKLLRTHSSTRERIDSDSYKFLLSYLNNLSPNSILDLACGINPLFLAPKFPKAKYYASDIKEDELKLLKEFFKTKKIKSSVFVADIRREKIFPKTDVCLILKVLDIIEKKGHKLAKSILENLNCKNLVISFATKTISGKDMRFKKRKWLESILEELNYEFRIAQSKNEIFYFCKLNSSGNCFSP